MCEHVPTVACLRQPPTIVLHTLEVNSLRSASLRPATPAAPSAGHLRLALYQPVTVSRAASTCNSHGLRHTLLCSLDCRPARESVRPGVWQHQAALVGSLLIRSLRLQHHKDSSPLDGSDNLGFLPAIG